MAAHLVVVHKVRDGRAYEKAGKHGNYEAQVEFSFDHLWAHCSWTNYARTRTTYFSLDYCVAPESGFARGRLAATRRGARGRGRNIAVVFRPDACCAMGRAICSGSYQLS